LKAKSAETFGVESSQLSLGNGSDEVLQTAIFALVSSNDSVVSFSPTFSEYKRICDLRGSKYDEIELDSPFTPDMDRLNEFVRASAPKLIILCNPNNPTGQVISKANIVDLLESTDAYVIVDEAYIDFGGESLLPYINQYKHLVVLRTFSKGYGLAALRFGFAIADPTTIELIESKRAPYNINQFTVAAVLDVLDNLAPVLRNIKIITSDREFVQNELTKLRIPYIQSSGNFILFSPFDISRLKKHLSEATFTLRFFDDNILGSFVRFSIGTKQQNDELLGMLKESSEGRFND
jgi:histidinol-phosphate aminotransferase